MLANEKVLTGKQAIEFLKKVLNRGGVPLSAQLYDGNDEGKAELVLNFDKETIETNVRRYPIVVLNKANFELIIEDPSEQTLSILDETKAPHERLLENINNRMIAYGLPVNALAMEIENKKEIALRK